MTRPLVERIQDLAAVDRGEPALNLLRHAALHGLDREKCLTVVAEAAPLICETGGAAAVLGCAQAITDAYRWWP